VRVLQRVADSYSHKTRHSTPHVFTHCTALHRTAPHCTSTHCTTLHINAQHHPPPAPHITAPHSIAALLHCTAALHCCTAALHCTPAHAPAPACAQGPTFSPLPPCNYYAGMRPPRDCAPVWCGQVISIEPNLVVHAIGSQPVTDSSPMAPGLWGLDRIDQVRETGPCAVIGRL
jgi:hypothetical protein